MKAPWEFILISVLIYGLGEILAHYLIFPVMTKLLGGRNQAATLTAHDNKDATELDRGGNAQLKGHLERAMLFLGFISGFPQVVIAFGALKIGTYFGQGEEKIDKDYYLIGNVVSITLALIYTLLAKWWLLEELSLFI